MKIRLLLADDHEAFRRELRAIIDCESDMEVVGEAANGKEAVDLARRLVPDVVIMDINMRFMNEYAVSRYFKTCKILQIVEGTSEIQRLVISRNL
jgi:DNA-binding NarL/FixJ family response regulator